MEIIKEDPKLKKTTPPFLWEVNIWIMKVTNWQLQNFFGEGDANAKKTRRKCLTHAMAHETLKLTSKTSYRHEPRWSLWSLYVKSFLQFQPSFIFLQMVKVQCKMSTSKNGYLAFFSLHMYIHIDSRDCFTMVYAYNSLKPWPQRLPHMLCVASLCKLSCKPFICVLRTWRTKQCNVFHYYESSCEVNVHLIYKIKYPPWN